MSNEWIKGRQTKFTAYVSVYILVILGVLGAINFLANRYNKSFDSTANKTFSLSEQTEKIVKNLKQDVKIQYFDDVRGLERGRDLLDRYKNLSPKVSVDFIDVAKKPIETRAAGVKAAGTTFIQAGTKKEEARSLTEEALTGAIIRAIKEGQKTVCSVSGADEKAFDDTKPDGLATAKAELEKSNYVTKSINLVADAKIPADCSILLIAGPKYDYVTPVVTAISEFVENGGDAMILLDAPLKMGKMQIADNAELSKLLEGWGVGLNKDLALDTSGFGRAVGLSAAVPLAVSYEQHPIVNDMKAATGFPYARTIDAKEGGKTKTSKLLSTTENSFAITDMNAKEVEFKEGRDKKGPLNLAVAGTLKAPSAEKRIGDGQGRFVVVGSSSWVMNEMISIRGLANKDLFLNMINWLSADEDLISIRPKDPEDRRLTMNQGQMNVMGLFSIFALPLVVVVSGIMMWLRRR